MDDSLAVRASRLYRNALLPETLKARAGEQLAEGLKAFLLAARYQSDDDLRAHLADLQAELAGYLTRIRVIKDEPSIRNELPDILEGLRKTAERRLRDDAFDTQEMGLESPFPDGAETTCYIQAGTIRAIARLLGIDTVGVEGVPSSVEVAPCPPAPRPSSTTPRSPASTASA